MNSVQSEHPWEKKEEGRLVMFHRVLVYRHLPNIGESIIDERTAGTTDVASYEDVFRVSF